MTTSKKEAAGVQATYVKDTAKGKKHFTIDANGVAGAIYLTPTEFKAMGEPDTLRVVIEGE